MDGTTALSGLRPSFLTAVLIERWRKTSFSRRTQVQADVPLHIDFGPHQRLRCLHLVHLVVLSLIVDARFIESASPVLDIDLMGKR